MKAIVIGGTGLVGRHIINELILHPGIREILVFTRRPLDLANIKVVNVIVDFDKIKEWEHEIQGDILFSALGTTLKDAGSKEAQYKVDHDYQYAVARAADKNKVKTYVLISSVNANPASKFFYLKMKGELEGKVMGLKFSSINIVRPGPLKGKRERPRWNEVLSTSILEKIPEKYLPETIRPVDASKVAHVAVKAALEDYIGRRIIPCYG